jgi:hypothetical protein
MGRESTGYAVAGECIAAGQRVCTANGVVNVADLAKSGGFQAVCYDHAARRFVLRNATASQAGRRNVIRLHTDKGSFEMTADQLVILQPDQTQSAAELIPGARLSGFALTPQTDYRVTSGDSGDQRFDLEHLTTADCAVANWYPSPSIENLGEAEVYSIELAEPGQSNVLIWTVGPGGGAGLAIK